MKKVSILIIVSLMFAMVSCQKAAIKPVSTSGSNSGATTSGMDNLRVPATFNWKTTQTISMTITATKGGLVNVSSTNGTSYQKAFLHANKAYTMKLVIPAYVKTLDLSFMGKKATLNITSSKMSYQFK